MDKELAKIVLMTALRVRIELGELPSIIKRHEKEDEDASIKHSIASAIYEIGLILDRVYDQHPELEKETEERRKKFNRPYY